MTALDKVDRSINAIYRFIGHISFVACAIMLVIVLIQVFSRYVLSHSLAWTEETARYLSIWISFLAIGLAFHKGELIAIDLFASLLPARTRILFETSSHTAVLFFLFYMTKYGYDLAIFSMNQRAPTLRIPMGYVYGAIPAGSVVMGIFVIWSLIRVWLVWRWEKI